MANGSPRIPVSDFRGKRLKSGTLRHGKKRRVSRRETDFSLFGLALVMRKQRQRKLAMSGPGNSFLAEIQRLSGLRPRRWRSARTANGSRSLPGPAEL